MSLSKEAVLEFGREREDIEIEEVDERSHQEWRVSMRTDDGIVLRVWENSEPDTIYSDGHIFGSGVIRRFDFPQSTAVFEDLLDSLTGRMEVNIISDGVYVLQRGGVNEEELPNVLDVQYGDEGRVPDVEKFRRLVEDDEIDEMEARVGLSSYRGEEPASIADIEEQLAEMRTAIESVDL